MTVDVDLEFFFPDFVRQFGLKGLKLERKTGRRARVRMHLRSIQCTSESVRVMTKPGDGVMVFEMGKIYRLIGGKLAAFLR